MQKHLDRIYTTQPRKFAFSAHNLDEFASWQAEFRIMLQLLLGIAERPPAPLVVQEIYTLDRGNYHEQKLYLDVGEDVQTPFYLLVPKTEPPFSPVLVFHGHEPSAQYCLGNYPDPETAYNNLAIDNNYAQALVEAGYLVGVVEQRGFGERLSNLVSAEKGRSCRHLSFTYMLLGRTLLGERVWDGMCAASYLLARPDVRGRLGCTGHSGGGATALWLSVLDPRLAVVVISGYFSSFRGSILSVEHCECNYVPGILALGEMGDLAALLAPRPFCVINGEQDQIFPVQTALEQFETVRQAYDLHASSSACQFKIHPGGHVYDHALAHTWFEQWLNR